MRRGRGQGEDQQEQGMYENAEMKSIILYINLRTLTNLRVHRDRCLISSAIT